jgi:integrase
MSTTALAIPTGGRLRCEHVFGSRVVGADVARCARRIDTAFLSETGWDATGLVLRPPASHAFVGRPLCRAPGCTTTAPMADRLCVACRRRLADRGLDVSLVDQLPPSRPRGANFGEVDVDDDAACRVAACTRTRVGSYCATHQRRWNEARSKRPRLNERYWRCTEAPVSHGGEVSFVGLAPLVIAQVLYGLQQRCRLKQVWTYESDLRVFCNELRASQAAHIADYRNLDEHRQPDFVSMVRTLTTYASRATASPETEVGKDVWDLTVLGRTGTMDFTVISQRWLREIAKRWAAEDLPRRVLRPGRPAAAAGAVREYLATLARLSEALRQRPDRGEVPAALGRADMEGFLHRLSYQESTGKITRHMRTRTCQRVRAVLNRARMMGLTRPGGPAAGLAEDFVLHHDDYPGRPEHGEPNRDLPAEILQQICTHLPTIASAEVHTAIELAIDTGRRPEEICELPYDCLGHDADSSPVLIYDNLKADRLGRRLPISATTAAVITGQQQRVRARYPQTPIKMLKLLPALLHNPDGTNAIRGYNLSGIHRVWIDGLPDLRTADGAEFDKQRIFLYAYRHSYAQRHADAGVPVDVLRELMDHRNLDTTKQYYRVGEARRREAVDRVAAMQFDRHGNRIWHDAKALLDSEHARRAVGEVAVPYGTCAEPSNVKAGGGACPYRFRCVGCDHFRTDVSYLPDLQAYLDDLLRTRERLRAATDVDAWARAEATPSQQEIARVRRLINRITSGLTDLDAADRALVDNAVATVRRHRATMLGMPRTRVAVPEPRSGATA